MSIKTPNVKVKPMRSKAGIGLFAMEPIKKGKTIVEYVGKIMTGEEGDNLNSLYTFNVAKNHDIDGRPKYNVARYANHSCRPNAEAAIIGKRVFISARKNIMLGEEITYDYGKEYWNEYIKPKGCKCVKCMEKAEVPKKATKSIKATKKTTK